MPLPPPPAPLLMPPFSMLPPPLPPFVFTPPPLPPLLPLACHCYVLHATLIIFRHITIDAVSITAAILRRHELMILRHAPLSFRLYATPPPPLLTPLFREARAACCRAPPIMP